MSPLGTHRPPRLRPGPGAEVPVHPTHPRFPPRLQQVLRARDNRVIYSYATHGGGGRVLLREKRAF